MKGQRSRPPLVCQFGLVTQEQVILDSPIFVGMNLVACVRGKYNFWIKSQKSRLQSFIMLRQELRYKETAISFRSQSVRFLGQKIPTNKRNLQTEGRAEYRAIFTSRSCIIWYRHRWSSVSRCLVAVACRCHGLVDVSNAARWCCRCSPLTALNYTDIGRQKTSVNAFSLTESCTIPYICMRLV